MVDACCGQGLQQGQIWSGELAQVGGNKAARIPTNRGCSLHTAKSDKVCMGVPPC